MSATWIISRVVWRYDEGHRAAVHGEPESVCLGNKAREGYRDACEQIKKWREETGGDRSTLPWYIDPEHCGPIFDAPLGGV